MFNAKVNGKKFVLLLTLILFSLALIGCGGGDGDSDSNNDDDNPEAYARFNNDLSCTNSGAFTATFTLNGQAMSSESTNWSTCTTQSTGTASWSLAVNSPCLTWDTSGHMDLAADTIYDFVMTVDNNQVVLIYLDKSGNCSSSTPFIIGQTATEIFDDPDNEYESMVEIALEADVEGVQKAE